MTDSHNMPRTLEQRFDAFLDRLGLQRVHLASGYAPDAITLMRALPERLLSVTLVSPTRFYPGPFQALGDRVLLIGGDRGPGAGTLPALLRDLPRAQSLRLVGQVDAAWSDTVADRADEIAGTMQTFLTSMPDADPVGLEPSESEIDGITYRVTGSGPPLVMLPVGLARSQWEPIVPMLARHFTTIVATGAFLGFVPTLEARMRSGYRTVVSNVVEAARPLHGERVLEVGCGAGAVVRHLARLTAIDTPITALDVNAYLLQEAANLTRVEGLADRIAFQLGDAESLPLPDAAFDVTLSFTVMEEVNADRMLAEMLRVTRPGGRIGVVVRAIDMLPWLNLELPDAVRAAAAAVGGAGAEDEGCADASLYRRFVAAGLRDRVMGPQYGADTAERSPERLRLFTGRIAQALEPDAATVFRDAVKRATDAGTMVWAEPYHCAVGVVPISR